jgi:hypothetical protein
LRLGLKLKSSYETFSASVTVIGPLARELIGSFFTLLIKGLDNFCGMVELALRDVSNFFMRAII